MDEKEIKKEIKKIMEGYKNVIINYLDEKKGKIPYEIAVEIILKGLAGISASTLLSIKGISLNELTDMFIKQLFWYIAFLKSEEGKDKNE